MDFQDYVGKKVGVKAEDREMKLDSLDEPIQYTHYELDENDPVIAEIKTKHSKVRVWLPNTMGTMDHVLTRLNIHIDKNDAGDYVISKVRYG